MKDNKIVDKIRQLKKKRNAIILVHNYQPSEVQDIADFLGDSLGLSIQASKVNADVIVFCGVYFMAETAKILSPQKIVLIPDKNAGCPLADTITAQQLKELKSQHPRAKVLCYVNTPAEVKAEADYCCTSANAVGVVNKALKDEEEIIFVPDKYLAHYVSRKTNRNFIVWQGYCPVHANISVEEVKRQKLLHPSAVVLVHLECSPDVIELADEVLSTEGMCKYAKKSKAKEIIVGTEVGIIYRLEKENPYKKFYPLSERAICSNMKIISLEKVLLSLEEMKEEVTLPKEIILSAEESICRMLEFRD
ncbi:MAG: quinolinate synthase NadA [Candidatus Omnitrophica bacterium]|nr:quinolinate synthase NadA [Candidatus Omnitrophota bacterium]